MVALAIPENLDGLVHVGVVVRRQAADPDDGTTNQTQAADPDGTANQTQATHPDDGTTNQTQATHPDDGTTNQTHAADPDDGTTNQTHAADPEDDTTNQSEYGLPYTNVRVLHDYIFIHKGKLRGLPCGTSDLTTWERKKNYKMSLTNIEILKELTKCPYLN
jgi:hypothetical protein